MWINADDSLHQGAETGFRLDSNILFNKVNKDVKIFMNGYNLSDKTYIASRIDGIQTGQGFMMMGGVKWTF